MTRFIQAWLDSLKWHDCQKHVYIFQHCAAVVRQVEQVIFDMWTGGIKDWTEDRMSLSRTLNPNLLPVVIPVPCMVAHCQCSVSVCWVMVEWGATGKALWIKRLYKCSEKYYTILNHGWHCHDGANFWPVKTVIIMTAYTVSPSWNMVP